MKRAISVMVFCVTASAGVALAQQPEPPAPTPPAPTDAVAPTPTEPSPAAEPVAATPAPAPSVTATAEPAPAAPGPAVSHFVAMDRLDANSMAGIEFSYLEPYAPNFGIDPTLRRFEGHARYIYKPLGVGGYIQVPLAYTKTETDDRRTKSWGLGNVEVGGIFAPKLPLPELPFELGLVGHLGVTLPTGDKGTDAINGQMQNLIMLPQAYNSLPRATTIKVGVSPLLRRGPLFARADVGFDTNVSAEDETAGNGLHFNAGVGYDFVSGAVMVESTNLWVMRTDDTPAAVLDVVAASARVRLGPVEPYFSVAVPLDKDIRDFVRLAFTAGTEINLP